MRATGPKFKPANKLQQIGVDKDHDGKTQHIFLKKMILNVEEKLQPVE